MKLEDLNHIRSRIKIKKKPKRCSIRELYIYQFSVYLPVWKIDDDRRIASRKGARNSMKTDVEQTSNNYESIGSPTKSNSARIPARMNNQIGTSVPHIYLETNGETENQQRVRFTDPPLRASIDFPFLPPFFFIPFPRGHEHDSSIRTKRNRCCYTLLRIQFYSAPSMVGSPVFRDYFEESNRKGYG